MERESYIHRYKYEYVHIATCSFNPVDDFNCFAYFENILSRIGRGGRFGRKGTAINFVTSDDFRKMEDLQKFYNTEILEMPSNIASLLWRMDVNTGQLTNTKHNIMWLKTELFDHYNKAIKNMAVVAFCSLPPYQVWDANTMFINKKFQTEACKNRFKPKHARIDEFHHSHRGSQWSRPCLLCMNAHKITHAVISWILSFVILIRNTQLVLLIYSERLVD